MRKRVRTKKRRDKKERHRQCLWCGSKRKIMPFRGLCKKCYYIFTKSLDYMTEKKSKRGT